MYYIHSEPYENGNYGNPQTEAYDGALQLPDELLDAYIETMGFAIFTVEGDTVQTVSVNQEAYDAYQASLPVPTPAELREQAYDNDPVIEWGGEMLTVTGAAQLWQYYAAEGSEKATELQTLIAPAKAHIRELYPDAE